MQVLPLAATALSQVLAPGGHLLREGLPGCSVCSRALHSVTVQGLPGWRLWACSPSSGVPAQWGGRGVSAAACRGMEVTQGPVWWPGAAAWGGVTEADPQATSRCAARAENPVPIPPAGRWAWRSGLPRATQTAALSQASGSEETALPVYKTGDAGGGAEQESGEIDNPWRGRWSQQDFCPGLPLRRL